MSSQVAGHLIDRISQVLPHARDALDLSLAAELALSAHLARDTRDLRGKYRQLLDHRIDEFGRAQEFTFECAPVYLEVHRLSQVTLGDRANSAGDLSGRPHQVINQGIEQIDGHGPAADRARHRHALS